MMQENVCTFTFDMSWFNIDKPKKDISAALGAF